MDTDRTRMRQKEKYVTRGESTARPIVVIASRCITEARESAETPFGDGFRGLRAFRGRHGWSGTTRPGPCSREFPPMDADDGGATP